MIRRAAVFLLILVSACSSVSQNSARPVAPDTIVPYVNVTEWEVFVPRDLTTSEAHLYYPLVDIVWRGDPPGDRYHQVEGIFQDALRWGMSAYNRGHRVRVSLEVVKFHAISEKARYSVGGVHTIRFLMSAKDLETGEVIMNRRKIVADLRALGGAAAVQADRDGRTQKARITQHLAGTLQRVLIDEGFGRLKVTPDER